MLEQHKREVEHDGHIAVITSILSQHISIMGLLFQYKMKLTWLLSIQLRELTELEFPKFSVLMLRSAITESSDDGDRQSSVCSDDGVPMA